MGNKTSKKTTKERDYIVEYESNVSNPVYYFKKLFGINPENWKEVRRYKSQEAAEEEAKIEKATALYNQGMSAQKKGNESAHGYEKLNRFTEAVRCYTEALSLSCDLNLSGKIRESMNYAKSFVQQLEEGKKIADESKVQGEQLKKQGLENIIRGKKDMALNMFKSAYGKCNQFISFYGPQSSEKDNNVDLQQKIKTLEEEKKVADKAMDMGNKFKMEGHQSELKHQKIENYESAIKQYGECERFYGENSESGRAKEVTQDLVNNVKEEMVKDNVINELEQFFRNNMDQGLERIHEKLLEESNESKRNGNELKHKVFEYTSRILSNKTNNLGLPEEIMTDINDKLKNLASEFNNQGKIIYDAGEGLEKAEGMFKVAHRLDPSNNEYNQNLDKNNQMMQYHKHLREALQCQRVAQAISKALNLDSGLKDYNEAKIKCALAKNKYEILLEKFREGDQKDSKVLSEKINEQIVNLDNILIQINKHILSEQISNLAVNQTTSLDSTDQDQSYELHIENRYVLPDHFLQV